MTYVITGACQKDFDCVAVCPVDCIHPREDEPGVDAVDMLFINPDECIDCGACEAECPHNAIFALDNVPSDQAVYIQKNADYYKH